MLLHLPSISKWISHSVKSGLLSHFPDLVYLYGETKASQLQKQIRSHRLPSADQVISFCHSNELIQTNPLYAHHKEGADLTLKVLFNALTDRNGVKDDQEHKKLDALTHTLLAHWPQNAANLDHHFSRVFKEYDTTRLHYLPAQKNNHIQPPRSSIFNTLLMKKLFSIAEHLEALNYPWALKDEEQPHCFNVWHAGVILLTASVSLLNTTESEPIILKPVHILLLAAARQGVEDTTSVVSFDSLTQSSTTISFGEWIEAMGFQYHWQSCFLQAQAEKEQSILLDVTAQSHYASTNVRQKSRL